MTTNGTNEVSTRKPINPESERVMVVNEAIAEDDERASRDLKLQARETIANCTNRSLHAQKATDKARAELLEVHGELSAVLGTVQSVAEFLQCLSPSSVDALREVSIDLRKIFDRLYAADRLSSFAAGMHADIRRTLYDLKHSGLLAKPE